MADLVKFPNQSNYYIRQAVVKYQKGDLASALSFLKEAHHISSDDSDFRFHVIQMFSEAHLLPETVDLIDGVLSFYPNDEHIDDLLSLYQDLLGDIDIDEMDEEDWMTQNSDFHQQILGYILFPEENEEHKEIDQPQEEKRINFDLQTIGSWDDNAQMSFLNQIDQMPAEQRNDLILRVLPYYQEPSIFRTDLLTRLMNNKEGAEKEIQVSDNSGRQQTISMQDYQPLTETEFYQEGKRTIETNNYKDPFLEATVLSEWMIICSFLYPFYGDLGEAGDWIESIEHQIQGLEPANDLERRIYRIRQKIFE